MHVIKGCDKIVTKMTPAWPSYMYVQVIWMLCCSRHSLTSLRCFPPNAELCGDNQFPTDLFSICGINGYVNVCVCVVLLKS